MARASDVPTIHQNKGGGAGKGSFLARDPNEGRIGKEKVVMNVEPRLKGMNMTG